MALDKIMVKQTITVKPNDTIARALEVMMKKGVNGTPVVDENNVLQGMIVKADIYRFLIDPGHYDSCPVEWVMTKEVVTAKESENISEVGKRLRENDIIAIPIIGDQNQVKGIVTIEDILDYFMDRNQ
ncbi:CBS domain-containing protein [Serpentinicella sp. ANB-PHB4]|uniref:CBS domain-containing protein n=1 Tax=Serpentinicella sp. ANB-PHB4 TaxID=3074076 RepID=UPI0028625892|nr:CBS domain-containing protein [Serpentinicella sp. ANB-PHB4]MDR5659490.1 CBS domain-containing protein [Serpentinicella sp. ANB-PHB4]